MRKLSLGLVLLAVCSAAGCKKYPRSAPPAAAAQEPPAPPPAKKSSCAEVGDNLRRILMADPSPWVADKAFLTSGLTRDQCDKHTWSSAAVACMHSAADSAAFKHCFSLLTPRQRSAWELVITTRM